MKLYSLDFSFIMLSHSIVIKSKYTTLFSRLWYGSALAQVEHSHIGWLWFWSYFNNS